MSPIKAAAWCVGSDHAGAQLGRAVVDALAGWGAEVTSQVPTAAGPHDYPHVAARVGGWVAGGNGLGVLVCGTGVGMSIAANRIAGVRAALCDHALVAELARAHNDANVLCLGQRVVAVELGLSILRAFFAGSFAGGRHQARVTALEGLAEARGGAR